MRTTKLTGIYKITCIANGKIRIGQTAGKHGFAGRWRGYKTGFKKGKNPTMAADYILYGDDAFKCEILLVLPKKLCTFFEQWYLDLEQPWVDTGKGYNECKTANTTAGRSPTVEALAKMSLAKRGKKLSPEHCSRISAALKIRDRSYSKGKAPHNKGKKTGPLSDEHRAKISTANKGKSSHNKGKPAHNSGKKTGPLSPEHRAKISVALKGIVRGPQTEEHRAKNSAAKKGKLTGAPSADHRAKISAAKKGKKTGPHSAARKANMLIAKLKYKNILLDVEIVPKLEEDETKCL